MSTSIRWTGAALILALAAVAVVPPRLAIAASAAAIDREVDAALATLYAMTPRAKELGEKAKGVLVFPNIVKAGFLVAAAVLAAFFVPIAVGGKGLRQSQARPRTPMTPEQEKLLLRESRRSSKASE